MDIVFLKDLMIGLAAVLAAGLGIWNFLQSPSKKNADEFAHFKEKDYGPFKAAVGEDIKLLDSQNDDTKARVAVVESTIKNMPDKDAHHQLDKKVTELSGIVNVVAESLKAVERTAHRIENFLLEQAKPKQ